MTYDEAERIAREAAHALPAMEYWRGTIEQGLIVVQLATAVSAAIVAALSQGLEVDETACVVVQVAADYGRRAYDDVFLQQLAAVVIARGDMPLPGRDDAVEASADDTMERLRELQAAAAKWPWDGGPPSDEAGEAGDG